MKKKIISTFLAIAILFGSVCAFGLDSQLTAEATPKMRQYGIVKITDDTVVYSNTGSISEELATLTAGETDHYKCIYIQNEGYGVVGNWLCIEYDAEGNTGYVKADEVTYMPSVQQCSLAIVTMKNNAPVYKGVTTESTVAYTVPAKYTVMSCKGFFFDVNGVKWYQLTNGYFVSGDDALVTRCSKREVSIGKATAFNDSGYCYLAPGSDVVVGTIPKRIDHDVFEAFTDKNGIKWTRVEKGWCSDEVDMSAKTWHNVNGYFKNFTNSNFKGTMVLNCDTTLYTSLNNCSELLPSGEVLPAGTEIECDGYYWYDINGRENYQWLYVCSVNGERTNAFVLLANVDKAAE